MKLISMLLNMLAYIGPGLGGGIVTAVIGFFTSIFLALFAIVWYPVKRVIRRFKGKNAHGNNVD